MAARKTKYALRSNYGNKRSASSIKYIVIHYTANDGDSDEGNANYFATAYRGASAHYFVDDDSITLSVPDNYVAWSVGGNKYSGTSGGKLYGKATNNNTLNIEMCDTLRDGSYNVSNKTLANTLELVREKMKQYNIPSSNVIRHYDVTGKSCPRYFVSESAWKSFKDKLTSGWIKDNTGWWYKHSDGSYTKNDWELINNAWYYFDERGYALSSTWKKIKNNWYYFNEDCAMKTGWFKDGKHWYYLLPKKSGNNPKGSMCLEWTEINNHWYYFNPVTKDNIPAGAARIGWVKDGKHWYYLSQKKTNEFPECAMVTGWFKDDKVWYYLNPNSKEQPRGSMYENKWLEYKGHDYYLKDNGAMACNETLTISYSFNKDGALE